MLGWFTRESVQFPSGAFSAAVVPEMGLRAQVRLIAVDEPRRKLPPLVWNALRYEFGEASKLAGKSTPWDLSIYNVDVEQAPSPAFAQLMINNPGIVILHAPAGGARMVEPEVGSLKEIADRSLAAICTSASAQATLEALSIPTLAFRFFDPGWLDAYAVQLLQLSHGIIWASPFLSAAAVITDELGIGALADDVDPILQNVGATLELVGGNPVGLAVGMPFARWLLRHGPATRSGQTVGHPPHLRRL